jgi:hypothetical protein
MTQKTTTYRLLKENPKPVNVSDKIYKEVWEKLNYIFTQSVIENGGEFFNFGGYFGKIGISRSKKRIVFDKNGKPILRVNWGKTKKYRKEGIIKSDKFVYTSSPYIFRFVWKRCRIKGSSAYSFEPSRTNGYSSKSGLNNRLWDFIKENDTNYLKFPLK